MARVFWVMVGILAVFAILSSCSKEQPPAVNETPAEPENTTAELVKNITVTETSVKPCENVKCKQNEFCADGKCVCKSDFRDCNGECIPAANCCGRIDCSQGHDCINRTCTRVDFCPYNMAFNMTKKACFCTGPTKWCDRQQKCIPNTLCCETIDCNPLGGTDRYCVPFEKEYQFCMKKGGESHCVKTRSNNRETFRLEGKNYDLYFDKIYEGGVVDLSIAFEGNKENIFKWDPAKGSTFTSSGLELYSEAFKTYGGNCRTAE